VLYRYIREQSVMETFKREDVLENLAHKEPDMLPIKPILQKQNKWTALEVLEGPLPEVDYGFDQLGWELELAVMWGEQIELEIMGDKALPGALKRLFERYRTRLNPDLDTQRIRLHRMANFYKAVEAVLPSDFIVLDEDGLLIDGWHILARAIMDGKTQVWAKQGVLGIPQASFEMDAWVEAKGIEKILYGDNPPY